MELAEPEAFKRSEEAVSSADLPVIELPFLDIQRYLSARGLGVPRIHYYDRDGGRLLLEDLGDLTLGDAIAGAPPERVEALYRQAIDELVRLQAPDPHADPSRCLAFGRRFDHRRGGDHHHLRHRHHRQLDAGHHARCQGKWLRRRKRGGR